MIGKQIHKPVQSWSEYTETALWCNANQAMIENRGDCYEVVALPKATLDDVRNAKLSETNGVCSAILTNALKNYPDVEVMTFERQPAEARAYRLDPASGISLLASLAGARGMELSSLAAKVRDRHQACSILSGAVIGQRQALVDRLETCRTVDEVNALPVNIGMPS